MLNASVLRNVLAGPLRASSPWMIIRSTPARFGSNRAKIGLYGGKDIGFGNKVSHSERKSRRSWKPNVQSKRLWSETLGQMVPFRVTTYALRCIDKAGGLDNYLMKTPPEKLGSTAGETAKARILMAMEMTEEEKAAFRAADILASRLKSFEFADKKTRKGGVKAAKQHREGVQMMIERDAELREAKQREAEAEVEAHAEAEFGREEAQS
mmetsp:Transcript_4172/g.8044  ORF Transcript_4172/g.8044 Transcript_4172/m.8044 type:complete len:210 (+) Transcript_4172:39-668(+)|eukprot:CAMPEP_0171654858 /NCGR_PEP_ID=MMETSP0990-20121206/40490_1 /TAXON_ID=483369 /ORGANISM="non described non described, Strain CCMP2098" /LENGTH=209 /DNA_ID=CAMNT_0012234729 /DNA_START=16 /DNA_END=645 /DNA_ORIENTATION=-